MEELEAENRLLRSKLGMVETAVISTAIQEESLLQVHTAAVHMRSSTDEKIQLFRSLFRGREDVFARRVGMIAAG